MTLLVGLTGGIGSGKTTVAERFAALGAGIVDTDLIAHQLTQAEGEAIPALTEAFGSRCIGENGAMDRDKMRNLVFSDATAKRRLEKLLHPLIYAHAQVELRQLRHKPYVLVVVPLLSESSAFRELVQRVLVVDCSLDTQIARVIRRSNLSESQVRAIIARQISRLERLKLADDVLDNDADLASLDGKVSVLHEFYLKNVKQ